MDCSIVEISGYRPFHDIEAIVKQVEGRSTEIHCEELLRNMTMEDINDGVNQSNGRTLPLIAVNQSKIEGIGSKDECNDEDIQFPPQIVGLPVTEEEDTTVGD